MTDDLGSLPKRHGCCPSQCLVRASCAPFWCRPGLATRRPVTVVIALPTRWDWITLRKRNCSTWNRNVAEAPSFPKEVLEALTHMYNRLGAYGRFRGDCNPLEKWQRSLPGKHGLWAIPWNTYGIHSGLYIWHPALYRLSWIHLVRACHRWWRSSTGSTVRTLWSSFSKPTLTGASQCLYPFKVRTQEDTAQAIESSERVGGRPARSPTNICQRGATHQLLKRITEHKFTNKIYCFSCYCIKKTKQLRTLPPLFRTSLHTTDIYTVYIYIYISSVYLYLFMLLYKCVVLLVQQESKLKLVLVLLFFF